MYITFYHAFQDGHNSIMQNEPKDIFVKRITVNLFSLRRRKFGYLRKFNRLIQRTLITTAVPLDYVTDTCVSKCCRQRSDDDVNMFKSESGF